MAYKITQARIPVDRIDPNSNQPRQVFDERALDELAASMRRQGQLQAITVRYNTRTRRYELISGERRWRAAQRAGIAELLAVVHHGVNDQESFRKAVAENLARADMTPLEESRAFKQLVDYGHSIPEVSELAGRSVEYVTFRLDLLNLVPAAAEALAKGHMPVGLAWYVCRLSPDGQHAFLGRWARGEFNGFRDAEAAAQALREREAAGDQAGLFTYDEPSPAERERLAARRRQVTSKIDRLAAAGAILQELAGMDPAELARLLAGADGGVQAYQQRVEHLRVAAAKAGAKLRKAHAIAAASTVELNPELVSA